MKQNIYSKRPRNRMRRPPNAKGGYSANRVFESNGPDNKLRGTAAQLHEKYLSLAREAQSSGDSVTAEGYFQHAEHYQRLLTAILEQNGNADRQQQRPSARSNGEEKPWHHKNTPVESKPASETNGSAPREPLAEAESQTRKEPHRRNVRRSRYDNSASSQPRDETGDPED